MKKLIITLGMVLTAVASAKPITQIDFTCTTYPNGTTICW